MIYRAKNKLKIMELQLHCSYPAIFIFQLFTLDLFTFAFNLSMERIRYITYLHIRI